MRSNTQWTSVFTNAFHDSCGCEALLCRFTILNALFIVVVIFPNTYKLIWLFWLIRVPKLLTDFSPQTLTNWTHSFLCVHWFRQSNVPLGLVLVINVELLVLTSGRQCGPILLFNHTEILFDWAELFYIPYVVTECVRISLDCTVNVILPVGLYLCTVTLRGEFASGKYIVFVAVLFSFVLFVFCLVCWISFNKTTNVHDMLALIARILNTRLW